MILYTLSTPILTPTHGTKSRLPPAASENIPTRLSYRPPPAIEPTPIVDSSGPSSEAVVAVGLGFRGLLAMDEVETDDGTGGLGEMDGGAEASVTASKTMPV